MTHVCTATESIRQAPGERSDCAKARNAAFYAPLMLLSCKRRHLAGAVRVPKKGALGVDAGPVAVHRFDSPYGRNNAHHSADFSRYDARRIAFRIAFVIKKKGVCT
jgi:hypothetical protein